MAQDTLYFPHDYDPFSDIKMDQFVKQHGATGYAVFWRLVELLHLDLHHRLSFKPYLYKSVAERLLVEPSQVEEIITDCINDYELFTSDGIEFWSERVFMNIAKRNHTKEQKSLAGKASAEARRKLKELVDAHPELMDE